MPGFNIAIGISFMYPLEKERGNYEAFVNGGVYNGAGPCEL